VFVAPDGRWRIDASLSTVDPEYVDALLALEDSRFRTHPGVDPIAIARAVITNVGAGRRVSGASTITMQLVRVLEPRPRTLRSKAIEALRAVQLEMRLSKKEILSAYLSFVPYGRNVEGVPAASLAYFGHTADALSPAEIATLLAVPQDPNGRYPLPANRERLIDARDRVAARLLDARALPLGSGDAALPAAEVLEIVRATSAPAALRPFPRDIPHAAHWLRARSPGDLAIRTTLDRGTQRIAEQTLARHRAHLAHDAIHNGSIVVIDHASGDVRALVGNFDWNDEAHGGQIAGFAEPRSPGSALKPFLYAHAIDMGVAGEGWLMSDVPTSFGGYVPKNFDGEFSGLVRLDDSLSRSLNLPFITLLQQVGVPRFLGTLRSAGAGTLGSDPSRYGLSAAVGGVEITPLELAGLYTVLAREGRWKPIAVRADERADGEAQVYSEGAAWLTRRVLERKDRPDFPKRGDFSRLPPRLHWKTGTSFGHRDALAAGSGQRFTAVVWLGNFDYSASGALIGAEAAGPVLFDTLEALEGRGKPIAADPPPKDLALVEVCAWSGRLPSPACPHRADALMPSRRVPTQTCPFHVAIDVDVATGLALTPGCRSGREWETRTFTVQPASVRRWLAERGKLENAPPAAAPGCAAMARKAPAILSPGRGEVLLLIDGIPWTDQQVPLEAEALPAGQSLSWFVNGQFLGTAAAEDRMWWTPRPGRHEIVVTDDSGAATRRTLEVRSRSVL
jgi:penicillin-binding protein 1C